MRVSPLPPLLEQHVINTVEKKEILSKLKEINLQKNNVLGLGKKSAVIIAGEALTKIQEDSESLKAAFLETTDWMDVVLACRVSPKQKGDIV